PCWQGPRVLVCRRSVVPRGHPARDGEQGAVVSAVTIAETCSCGATFKATGSEYRSSTHHANPRGVEEMAERWRIEHRHEFPPQPPQPEPMGREVDMGSQVERAERYMGFTAIEPYEYPEDR